MPLKRAPTSFDTSASIEKPSGAFHSAYDSGAPAGASAALPITESSFVVDVSGFVVSEGALRIESDLVSSTEEVGVGSAGGAA